MQNMTATNTQLGGSVLNAGPTGHGLVEESYGKLPPLNPDDLKLPPPPPSAADKVTNTADAISIGEIWEELKAKTRELIMGSSVSGVLSAIRAINITIAASMIALAVCVIIQSESLFAVISDAMAVVYTIFFGLILIGYELRSTKVDEILRESFGFMYSPWGRCLFLSMISIFPCGMLGIYGIMISLCGFANAYFNYFVITKHPSFTRGVPDYTPPVAVPEPTRAEDVTIDV